MFDTKEVLARLAHIDRTNGYKLGGNILPSRHWSRIYEYPYAAYQLRNVPGGGRILDCGCGLASFQFYLAEKGFEVHAIDNNLRALQRVAALKKSFGLTNLKPTFGSILKLPFTSGYFDGVVCISVLEHMMLSPENSSLIIRGSINEMLRVLKEGGVLTLTFDVNFGKEQRSLKPKEYAELCSALNLNPEPLPKDRLYSSDTKEGSLMGEDLTVYSVTLARS
jgi:SAM-dependent methyltransferase